MEDQTPLSKRAELLWLAGSLLLLALIGLPTLLYPLGRDQAIFAVIADRWGQGAIPYQDTWDIKPPGIFLLYGLAMHGLGRSMAAIRGADLLATLLAAAGLYAIARRHAAATCAALAVLLFGLLYYLSFDYWNTAQAESFSAPLAVLLIYSLLRTAKTRAPRWWVLAGGCLGCLILLKTTFVLLAPLPVLAWFRLYRAPERRSGLFRAGSLCVLAAGTPLLLTVLYFGCAGALPALGELLQAQAGYARGQHHGFWFRSAAELSGLVARPALLLGYFSLAGGLCSARYRRHPDLPILLAWLGISLGMTVAQGRLYIYHWLPTLPPLALLASLALHTAWRAVGRARSSVGKTTGTALLAAGLLFPMACSFGYFWQAWQAVTGQVDRESYWRPFQGPSAYSFLEDWQIAGYIGSRTEPDQTVLVLAFEPAIYFLAERASPTRHLSTAPLIGETQIPWPLRRRWQAEQRDDVRERPPCYLVLALGTRLEALQYQDDHHLRFAGLNYVYETRTEHLLVYHLQEDGERSMAKK